jgi:hypothetical protein
VWALSRRTGLFIVSYVPLALMFMVLKGSGGWSLTELIELECDPSRAVELLDALEGRFFGDAFSTEKRRADRFRKRR